MHTTEPLTQRLYAGEQDLPALLALLVAARAQERRDSFPGPYDLREALALPAVRENTRLWYNETGILVAFAYVDLYHNLRFEYLAACASPTLEAAIVAWGVDCMRHRLPVSAEPLTLDASCRANDHSRIELLERHGFARQPTQTLLLTRPLDLPLPAPQPPPGLRLRHVTGEAEVEALVALHRAAFGTEHMSVTERLAMMRNPGYDPELDLVAIAPDGRYAAYCFCSIDAEENARTGQNLGYTDPIATHPDFQRRGLARALLCTAFQKLKQRGIANAALGTSSDNLPMLRAAASAGFQIAAATLWFSKSITTQCSSPAAPRTSCFNRFAR